MTNAAEFPPTGRPEWEARLAAEQKQADALAHLTRPLPEGIALPPLFTQADRPALTIPVTAPGYRIQQVLHGDVAGTWQPRWQVAQAAGAEALHLTLDPAYNDWQTLDAIAANAPLTLATPNPEAVPANLRPHLLAHPAIAQLEGHRSQIQGILPVSRVADWGGSAVAELTLLLWAQQSAPPLQAVELSLGRHFLTDVAKLRAARLLAPNAEVRALLSKWNLAATEPETNLLRATTAAMAGIIGGAQVIAIPPHGGLAQPEDADRWARGILLLLRHESHLDAVADPAAGSYALEWLTAQLVEQAQLLWQAMQASQDPAAYLRQRIQADAAARASSLQSGQEVLLGVNRFHPKGKDPRQAEAHQPSFQPERLAPWAAAAEAAHANPPA